MPKLLQHTIQNAAIRFPEKDAFRCGNKAVTYASLVKITNQLAGLLIDSGVKKGDRVGIYLNRSLETALAIYGIMNAGAVYVPLDPLAPPSRTRYLIHDCEIEHLITNAGQKRSLNIVFSEPVKLSTVIGCKGDWPFSSFSWEEVAELPDLEPEVNIHENDLAYIMYTSGSTGVPKGIMHTHYSGLNYAKLSASLYRLNEHDRIGNHAPLHFDISTLGYFSSPLAAATCIIVPDAHTKMPASLTQLMENERLTVWYSVPLALTQMLSRGVLDQRDLSTLRWVLFGGEPFQVKHLRRLMQQWPHARFSNVYGPAEVNQCTYYHLPGLPENNEPVPLGVVWDKTEMLILDKHDQKVVTGQTGELLISTITMMKGYWKQPELTQKSLYILKNNSGKEKIFYRTGDLVKMNADGNMSFLGRKDRQVKTRGYRVELDEVESTLVKHNLVEEAAVFPVKVNDEGQYIEAAVILIKGVEISENDLKIHLNKYLPWYAIPRKILISQSLPRTSTGKINRLLLQQQLSKLMNE